MLDPIQRGPEVGPMMHTVLLPVNMLDPIQRGPEVGPMMHTVLLPDQICLAQIRRSQPDSNWTQDGFAQYDLGQLWKKAIKYKSGKLVADGLHSARTGPDHSCTPAPFWAFFGRTELNWAHEVRSGIYTTQPDSGWP